MMGATLEATPVHDDGNSLRQSVLVESHGAWMLVKPSRKEGPKKGNLETLAGYANNSTTQQLPRPQPQTTTLTFCVGIVPTPR